MKSPDTPLPPIAIQVTPIELVEPDGSGRVTRGPREQVRKLTDQEVREAFDVVEYMAGHAADMLGRVQQQPDRQHPSGMELEFGLSFNSELKVYVVGAKAEASLKVKLTWKADGAAPASQE